MKKELLILMFSVISTSIFAVDLVGGWSNYTPNNNIITERQQLIIFSFSNNNFSYSHPSKKLKELQRWYFYKGFIIGEYDEGFFIIDEKKEEIKLFKYQDRWENYIKNNGLRPHRWTRWFNTGWNLLSDFWVLFFLAPIVFVLLIFYIRLIYISIKKERFNLSKPYSMLTIISFLSLVIFVLLDIYPDS